MVERLTAERDAWKALALARGHELNAALEPMAIQADASQATYAAEESMRALGIDPITGERL